MGTTPNHEMFNDRSRTSEVLSDNRIGSHSTDNQDEEDQAALQLRQLLPSLKSNRTEED